MLTSFGHALTKEHIEAFGEGKRRAFQGLAGKRKAGITTGKYLSFC